MLFLTAYECRVINFFVLMLNVTKAICKDVTKSVLHLISKHILCIPIIKTPAIQIPCNMTPRFIMFSDAKLN